MSISILGGKAKGAKLQVLNDKGLRPTSVLLKRKLFDKYQSLDGYYFIDIFSGTGSVALEAWSRGASFIELNELSKKTFKLLNQNIKALEKYGIESTQFQVYQTDALIFLKQFLRRYQKFDREQQENTIIFIDPPYAKKELYQDTYEVLKNSSFVGKVWIESDQQKGFLLDELKALYAQGAEFEKSLSQGTRYFLLFQY